MLKRSWLCFKSSSVLDNASNARQDHPQITQETVSFSVSAQIKDVSVRIVHAGGRIEMYQTAVPAFKLMEKYPGTCVARPSVFKRPHESVVSADDLLLPGNKYFIIRSSTVEKLKRKNEPKERDVGSDNNGEESVCSPGDFYVPKDNWSVLRKHVMKEKKKFVPPIQRPPRVWREAEWEPSLTSIQEISP